MDLQRSICEEHASEAAFLWTQRDRGVLDPSYDRDDIASLDERIETHLDGLRHASSTGVACVKVMVEDEPGPGEAFVATLVAMEQEDVRAVAHVLDIAGEEPLAARGIVSALGWAPQTIFESLLPGFLSPRCPPALRRLGLRACAIRRLRISDAVFESALSSSDVHLRACALRTIGELKESKLIHHLRMFLDDDEELGRFWSAWSGTMLVDSPAIERLWAFAMQPNPRAELAAMTAAGRLDARRVAGDVHALVNVEGGFRAAFAAATALGDPVLIPWLIERMADATMARRAGLALSMITGVNLGYEPFEGQTPANGSSGPTDDPDDDDVAVDPDEDLPFPKLEAVRDWWRDEREKFAAGCRFLCGKQVTDVHEMERLLESGNQLARFLAALHLTFHGHRQVLPEVRAVGWR